VTLKAGPSQWAETITMARGVQDNVAARERCGICSTLLDLRRF